VAKNLRRFRLQRGLSQGELAAEVGVTYQQIQRYESGSQAPGTDRLRRLCAALNVTPNDLFGIDGQPAPRPELSDDALAAAAALDGIAQPTLRCVITDLVCMLARDMVGTETVGGQ
jgi:transcriptional regulator with XRE-family HTH domain